MVNVGPHFSPTSDKIPTMTTKHSCLYCTESVTDLVNAANLLARLLARPQQVIGHNARSRAEQYRGAQQDFNDINTCVAARS